MSDRPVYPTLSHGPERMGYRRMRSDPTLRSDTDDGRPQYRDSSAPTLYEEWIPYAALTAADVVLLEAFQDTIRVGVTAFDYNNPYRGSVIITRLLEPMVFEKDSAETFSTMLHTRQDANDVATSPSSSPSASKSSSASASPSSSVSSSPSSSVSISPSSSVSSSVSASPSSSASAS